MCLHRSHLKKLRFVLALSLLSCAAVACSSQDEGDAGASAYDVVDGDDASANAGGSASSDNTNHEDGSGASGEGSSSTAGSQSRCPEYTTLNNSVGSWFQYAKADDKYPYNLRSTIKAVREEPGGTYITVTGEETYFDGTERSTASTYLCDGRGLHLLEVAFPLNDIEGSDGEESHRVHDYGDGALVMPWNASPGDSWTSAYTVADNKYGDGQRSVHRDDYKMLGKTLTTTPAGSFYGVELEITATRDWDSVHLWSSVYDRKLGFISNDTYVLEDYELK